MHEGKKAYIYTRVSTAMQVDGYSLDAQENTLKSYILAHQMVLVRKYTDEGKSGTTIANRDGFQCMIDDVVNGKDEVDFIIVFKLSRFGRKASDVLNTLETIKKHGVDLICVEDGIDSSTPVGKVILTILSAIAEMERENIVAQSLAGRRMKAIKGGWNGGFAPYGYRLVDGKLEVEEDEAILVKKIFKMFINSPLGALGVASRLNNEGITKKVRQNGYREEITADFVKTVLDNPVYTGHIQYGARHTIKVGNRTSIVKQTDESKIIISKEQTHEAIISQEVFERAKQKRIETGVKKDKKEKDHEYILSGLLKCPECGKSLYGVPSRKKKKDGTYYKTSYSYKCRAKKQVTGNNCIFKTHIKCSSVEEEVTAILSQIVQDKEIIEYVKSQLGQEIDTKEIKKKIIDLQKKQQRLIKQQYTLEAQIDNLDIDDIHYSRMKESLDRRLQTAFDELDKVEINIVEQEELLVATEQNILTQQSIFTALLHFEKLYEQMTDYEKKTLMSAFISSIDVYNERENGHWIKCIHFNFPVMKDGKPVVDFSVPKDNSVETVVLMSKVK